MANLAETCIVRGKKQTLGWRSFSHRLEGDSKTDHRITKIPLYLTILEQEVKFQDNEVVSTQRPCLHQTHRPQDEQGYSLWRKGEP